MYYEKNGSLNYTFTAAGVEYNDLVWGDIKVVVNPDPTAIYAPSDSNTINSGDKIIIEFSDAIDTEVTLVYEPSGGLAYQSFLTP